MSLRTRDSNNPLRFDFLIFLLWHRGQWVGIRVLPDPTAMTSYNIRARTRGASVQFCTPIPATKGELFGKTNAKHLLRWRASSRGETR